MRKFISLVDQVNHWVFNLIAVLLAGTALLSLYQVFARYVLKKPLVWSEECIRYAVIWLVLLGTAVAMRKGLLISVEIVLQLVPQKIRRMMEVLVVLCNIVFLAILTVYGFRIMGTLDGQTSGALDLPVAWMYAAIPAGASLTLLNSIVVGIELFVKKGGHQDDGTVTY